MSILLLHEIEELKKKLLTLAAMANENVGLAVKAVQERDEELTKRVIQGDTEIDSMEIELEEDALKILALHQPVAVDLRFIVAALKINNDLERIGDLAVNIAKRGRSLRGCPVPDQPLNILDMADKVKTILDLSLQSVVRLDADIARHVLASDNEIDDMNKKARRMIIEGMKRNVDHVETYCYYLNVSRNLERIGDHATNIAEDVLYLVEGVIIRHGAEPM